jgi:type IV pilus assembly protein PilA
MQAHRIRSGFTLIELMVVVAVVAILSLIAVPSFQDRVIRNQVGEGVTLVDFVRQSVQAYFTRVHAMPVDNAEAALPNAAQIVSNVVSGVAVNDGAITVTFGNRANPNLAGKKLTLRPAVVDAAPVVPISWICGRAAVPAGMTVRGIDATNLPAIYLPLNCR